MAKKESTGLVKTEWVSNFNLIGEAVLSDFTFKIDEKSEKSDWVYNSINLGVDCGEKHGTVYCELMNGYGSERDNVIYVHGKKDDGSDDFQNQYTIDWDDRFDEDILKDIGDLCFLTVGLERTADNETFYKKFLTGYDAIAYMNEHLQNGMVVHVRGQLKYTLYNGNVQCRKEINSIYLSFDKKTKEVTSPENYKATFIQTMLLDQDSCTKKSLDADKGVLIVDAYILEKFKEYNGYDLTDGGKVKGGQFVPLRRTFEYEVDLKTDAGKAKLNAVLGSDKMFKVKKGTVTQITFEGEFVESGATVKTTIDDLDDDIKELIAIGVYTEEEALAKCATNGSRERRMLITQPNIKKIDDGDKKIAVINITQEKFTDEDLLLECLTAKDDDDDDADVDTDEEVVEETEEDTEDWLKMLG